MSKKQPPRDVKAEHEKAVAKYQAQGEPAVWACFFWPHLNRWQCIGAWEAHRQLVPAARALVVQGRQAYGDPNPSDKTILGDTANAVAYMVLRQMDDPKMGAMLMLISDLCGERFFMCTSKPPETRRNERGEALEGGVITIDPIPATTYEQARTWVQAHPGINAANMMMLADVLKGPKH